MVYNYYSFQSLCETCLKSWKVRVSIISHNMFEVDEAIQALCRYLNNMNRVNIVAASSAKFC